ncbi:proton-coupled amino acid transporter-like protein CG1139 [Neocloeon triangulifer]|uniref:proton-coupled amino acid transporter-like protein CG1139 n=1 Tax=Neocloeon triangulifer TaxID=2078957 RepID=UPI00286EF12C|nr:proton-coupled amino acid transporter-like protein CG1139 [Neocloeon triangulifer]
MESGGKMESGLDNPAFVQDSPKNERRKSKESLASADYEPYSQRVVALPTSNLETLLHLVKGSMGSGILAMPNAFKNAGYAFGFVATIAIGVICTYTVHLLVESSYALCKRRKVPSLDYPETMIEAMKEGPGFMPKIAPYAGYIVNFFIFWFQVGTCCVYFVFISSNLQLVLNNYTTDVIDVRLYMCMILLPIMLLNCVRQLKYLAPFSGLSNILIVSGVGIILYFIFRDGLPDIGERNWIGEARGIPLFFGTVLFALECIGVIMPLENNMKSPKNFGGATGVFNQAMTIIIFLYTGLGLLGYLEYGEKILGSITLNLPEEVLSQVVQIMMALAIFLTYPLQCYVAVDILWTTYISPKVDNKKYRLFGEYGVRCGIVLLTFGLAVAIPNLELFISLVGALSLSVVGIILPPIIAFATFKHQRRGWRVFKNIAIVIFGILGMITGTYVSIVDIIESLF